MVVDMNFELARFNMIEQQIRPWEVLDQRVLGTIARIPREEFLPPQYRRLAFVDMEIPLGHGQMTMAPKVEARMLQLLNVKPQDTVLEVGTGSGYVTALLATLASAGRVHSVDIIPEFKAPAQRRLTDHGIGNATLETGNAVNGWDHHGPYDVIAITGSLPHLTDRFNNFLESLNQGGRLFVVVGEAPIMEALLFTRVGEKEWRRESVFETVVPSLVNASKPSRFVL